MNPELYQEEFRDFKFLKCSPHSIECFKSTKFQLDRIRPPGQEENENFSWSSRIEFIEQIIDLRLDHIYIVEPGELVRTADATVNTKVHYTYEDGRINRIKYPMIYMGHPVYPADGREINLDDIKIIEEDPTADTDYFLCSGLHLGGRSLEPNTTETSIRIFNLRGISLIPSRIFSYTAIFYSLAEAESYKNALTKFLRNNCGAISAISNLI